MSNRLLTKDQLKLALSIKAKEKTAGSTSQGGTAVPTVQNSNYYTRPDFGAQTEALYTAAKGTESTLGKKQTELQTASGAYEQSKARLAFYTEYYNRANSYYKSGKISNPEEISKAKQMYQSEFQKYVQNARAFDTAKAEYDSAYGSYSKAVKTYNDYVTDQEKQFDTWKGTIRGMDAVQADLDAVNAQINELEKNRQGNSWLFTALSGNGDTTLPMGALQGEGISDNSVRPEMQELLDRRALLQEEAEWSQYFREQDIYENADQFLKEAEQAYQDYLASEEYRIWKNEEERKTASGAYLMDVGGTMVSAPAAKNAKEQELKSTVAYYQGIITSKKEAEMLQRDMEEFVSWPEEDQAALVSYIAEREQESYNFLNQADPSFFNARTNANALFEKYGAKKVMEMAESYTRSKNQEFSQDMTQEARESAGKGFWSGAGHSALSVGANLLGSMTSPLGYLTELPKSTGRYSTLDPNNAGMIFNQYSGAVREEISSDLEEKHGEVVSTLYNAGMSAADNFARLVAGGKGSLALAAAGTFGQSVSQYSGKGASPVEALGLGVIDAALEVLTEKVSLDNLLKGIDNPKDAMETVLNMLIQGGVEVTEEEASFIGSTLAEAAILRERSSYRQHIAGLQALGYSYEQAEEIASEAVVKEAANTAIQSFLSGNIMSGATSAYSHTVNRIQEKAEERQLKNTVTQAAQTIQQESEQQDPTEDGESFSDNITKQILNHWSGDDSGTQSVTVPEGVNVEREKVQQAERIAKATGRQIVFYSSPSTNAGIENGYYQNGVIYVNTQSENPMAQIFSHELTHSVEMADSYKELSSLVMKRIKATGGDLKKLRQEKRELYARNGIDLQSEEDVDSEIVASYVEQYLLTDEQSIMSLTTESPSLGRKILNWLDSILAKLGNTNAQERTFLTQARNAYARALSQTPSSSNPQTNAAANSRNTGSNNAKPDSGNSGMTMEQQKEWADGMLKSGEWTDEQYNDFLDEYYAYQEQNGIDGMAREDRRYEQDDSTPDRQHSISEIQGQEDAYGTGVILDTNIFDGVRPRAWGKVLSDYVYKHLAGAELTVFDENGNPETIHLAKSNERVWKDGAKNSHRVIDKLARYRGDNIKALATVHLSELLETSKHEITTDEHSHQWMDENGWEYRKTYIQDRNGNIYEAVLNIADGRDRKILYEINNVRQIDKRAARGVVPSTDSGRGSHTKSNSSMDNITDDAPDVKRKYSISDQTVNKRDVANDLRAILNRGGDMSELRQYVRSLEQTGSGAEQTGETAAQILRAAQRQGISVSEYLSQNWEQYEVDGEWNTEAREALRQEGRSSRRYSISDAEGDTTSGDTTESEEQAPTYSRDTLPTKARNYLEGAERSLLSMVAQKLGVTKFVNRESLQELAKEISNEYLEKGRITDDKFDLFFDKAYAEGIIQDWSFYNKYKDLKKHLQTTAVTLREQDRHDIADYNSFRKSTRGTLRIVNDGGLPVDSAYQELTEMAPKLFPEKITHPADQLQRMFEVGQSIQVSEKTLKEFYGSEADFYRSAAKNEFSSAVNGFIQDLRQVKRYADARAATESEKAPTTPEEAAEAWKQLKDARKTYDRAAAKNLLTPHDEIQVGRLLRGEIELEHLDPDNDNIKGITAVYEAKQEYERLNKLLKEYQRQRRAERQQKADTYLGTANEWKDKGTGLAYARETMRRNIYDIVPDRVLAEKILKEYFEPVHDAVADSTRFKTEYRNRIRELDLSRKVAKGNLVSEAHAVQLVGEAMDNIRMLENTRGRIKNRDGRTLEEWNDVISSLWAENPGLDKAKIERAIEEFRKIYDELFQEMNRVRVENGYEPVNYRQGYFPHFQPGDGDGILSFFGKALGIDTQVEALPTTINGLTHTFKPGIQWFGNAQERLGFNTVYDAVEGFDKYIEGVAEVIHLTEHIQNLRALASRIRYRTSDEGIRKQVDAVAADTRLKEEERQMKIRDIYEHGKYTLSNFVNELDEYTNKLANKKSKYDRIMEAAMGRKIYSFMKAWESRVGANMIAGNISSALTNFIPLTQAWGQLDTVSFLKGMRNTLACIKKSDGIAGMSSFLTNRRGSDPLVRVWEQQGIGYGESFLERKLVPQKLREKDGYQKAKRNVSSAYKTSKGVMSEWAGMPMELIDSIVSESIVRGAYYQNLSRGMSETEAMHQADIFASNVMADRSKGAMPTLFEATNPIFKAFTQFQLEVNNQFSEIFKDLPRAYKEKKKRALALALFKYLLGAFLFNELFELLFGRRAALDPIGLLNDTIGDFTGYELPNLFEMTGNALTGKETSFENDSGRTSDEGLISVIHEIAEINKMKNLTDEERKTLLGEQYDRLRGIIGDTGRNLTTNILGELPFSSGLTMIGIETDGGRLPASSAVPDFSALWDAATKEGWSAEKRWKEAQDELNKLAYVITPFGGNQISKVWKGIKAYNEGGSYSVDTEGNDVLQYPVFKNEDLSDFWTLARAMVMGKSSLPEAQNWVNDGFDSLTAKQTAVYQDLLAAGVDDRKAYDIIDQIRNVSKPNTEDGTKIQKEERQDILLSSQIPEEGKAIVFYGMMATEGQQELMDLLADVGADTEGMTKFTIDFTNSEATASDKRELLRNFEMPGEGKAQVYYEKILSDASEKERLLMDELKRSGADMGEVTDVLMAIHDADSMSGAEASCAKRTALINSKLSDGEKWDIYVGKISDSRTEEYENFLKVGLDVDMLLAAHNEYARISEKDIDAVQKATEFSKWVNELGIENTQSETIKNSFMYYNMFPATAERYERISAAGIDSDTAFSISNAISELEPEEGENQISNYQKWKVVIESGLSDEDQMKALMGVMTEEQYTRAEIAYNCGLSPEAYVEFKNVLSDYDEDGSDTLSKAEVKAAIDDFSDGGSLYEILTGTGIEGMRLSDEEKAVLWQIQNKSWKPWGNPYDTKIGELVYNALHAEDEEA